MFWEPEPNVRKVMFLRALGVLMLAVYGWFIIASIFRFVRGTWSSHCDSRIAFFRGVDDSVV